MNASTHIIQDIIVPALLARSKVSVPTNVDISKWWRTETRIYRDPTNQYNLLAEDFYAEVNSHLPPTVAVSSLAYDDPRIIVHCKGQCGYFYLRHPRGDCYGILLGGEDVFFLFQVE